MSVFHNGVTYRAADAHAHIYPGKIAEKATGSVGEFYHIPMQNVGLPHILAQRGEEAGIDRFLVCSVATKVEQVRSINQFIQEKCQKYPQFIGLAAWHQDVADIQGEMDDIQRRGLRGIKLHPDFQRFYIDDERMLPVYEEAHRRGLPILFHTGDSRTDFSTPRRLMNVLEKIPDFTCIAAHLGGYSEWEDARFGNDIAPTPSPKSRPRHRPFGIEPSLARTSHVVPQGGAGALLPWTARRTTEVSTATSRLLAWRTDG
ncbi:MAG: amidohydrolase family protein [Acutalibacter sp.]